MSSEARQSPRAAIRDWLSHNDGESKCPRPRLDFADDLGKERRPRQRHRPRPHLDAGDVLLQPGASISRNRQDNQGDRRQKRPEQLDKITTGRLDDGGGVSLAERLNLHAPFRSFGNANDFEDINDSRSGHARKRRRSPSSTSSDLEPAALPVEPLNEKVDRKASSEHKRRGIHDDTTSLSASEPLHSSSDTFLSPEKPNKTYERRSRHKTKEDRYELKHSKAAVKQKRDTKDRKKGDAKRVKKSKLRKKSGAALVHDFAAHNVAQDRLTLKPPVSLGIFKRGRASSPVRRRGLPDLTFSEMTFLNPRQDKPQDIVNSTDQKKRRRKDQTIETEAEISRYFASAKARDVDATTARKERARSLEASRPHEKYRKRSEAEKFAYLDRSSLPPVELPERPFLGFGSVGGSLVSPVRRSEFPVSSPRQSYPIQRDLSPTRSTSYFSWAETRSPSHRLSRHRENESVPPVLPKGTPTVGDLVANSNIGQGIASGTPLSCEDNIMDKRDTRKRKTSYGRREDITTIPDNRVSNGPQEQILDPPRSISDLEQRQAKNVGPELVEKSKTPQYQQTPAAHGSNDHNAHTNPPLPELNDLKSKRPEDLINATLKLLLEKYGASTASPCAAVGIANETPKSPDAATNDNDPRVPTCHVPTLAKGGDGEATEKDSSQGGVHGMIAPPRPFSRRTVPSKTQSIDKPSRHDYPFEDATMVSRDTTEGALKGSQATQGPQGSLNPSQHRRTDTKSAWNGYDAIYERQSISEELQYNPHGNQIRDDPAFNGDMMNHSTTTSDYELKDRYGSGFDDIYDDCSPDNRHRSNSYDIQLEAESYQGQVHSEGTRSQQLDEPYCYARPLEALEERFLDCGNGYLPKEEPPFRYNSPELGQTALSKDLFVKPQYATQDSSRSYLPIRGMLRDEPPRALYSRPHTQGSSHGSIQHNLVSFPDQIDNESLSGFWKPHRLY